MPESKLAEKLGKLFATIHEGGPKNCTCRLEKFVDGPIPCVTCQFKAAEKELRDLLTRFQDLRKAADEASFFLGTVWTAQSLNTPNEKTTHHVWTNLQKALTDLLKPAADPERKDA